MWNSILNIILNELPTTIMKIFLLLLTKEQKLQFLILIKYLNRVKLSEWIDGMEVKGSGRIVC